MNSIPEVSDLDMAFPTKFKELLPAWSSLSEEEKEGRTIFCKAAQSLMFSGGKLEDFGVKVKEGYETAKVYRYLRATLGDWGPKHEHKIGGIGHMLAKWCDPISAKTPA